jgi:hypothetical protein
MITDLQAYARKGLKAELVRLDGERDRVRALLASLDGSTSRAPSPPPAARRRGQMSEAGRQAIRDAQKRRWAKVRGEAAASAGSRDQAAQTEAGATLREPARRASRTGNRKK